MVFFSLLAWPSQNFFQLPTPMSLIGQGGSILLLHYLLNPWAVRWPHQTLETFFTGQPIWIRIRATNDSLVLSLLLKVTFSSSFLKFVEYVEGHDEVFERKDCRRQSSRIEGQRIEGERERGKKLRQKTKNGQIYFLRISAF